MMSRCERLVVMLSICCAMPAAAASSDEYVISTIAGGVAPRTPIAAGRASIGSIAGMTVDASGNVYLSTDLNCVFKIDSARIVVTRFAGTCRPGYAGDGGPAITAQLRRPTGLAVDGKGALYIVDADNQVVRKVSPGGVITTIAGTGQNTGSGNGGPAIRAALTNPQAVAADSFGNVYIAENNAIRRVSTNGTITNVAGGWAPGIAADGATPIKPQWLTANSLAVGSAGTLYYSDAVNHKVGRISRAGIIETVAGTGQSGYSGDGGPAANAQLSSPSSIALDPQGNIYIADSRNCRVRKVSLDGTITTIAGVGAKGPAGDDGPAIRAAVTPTSLAVDTHGMIYVTGDNGFGSRPSRLRRISTDGTISTIAPNAFPVSKDRQRAVRSALRDPAEIAVDSTGNVFVAEFNERRIRKIDKHGRISTVAGGGPCCALGDGGPATRAVLDIGFSMAADATGNLYISQPNLHTIRKVSPKGVITTIAGTGSAGFSGDGGPALRAQFNRPGPLAVDDAGNLFIADIANNRVRKITPDGTITTVAGNGTTTKPIRDGSPAVDAPLRNLNKVAVDAEGNLFIDDSGSVRKVSRAGIISTVYTTSGVQGTFAADAAGTLYMTAGSMLVRLSPEGTPDPIAGTGETGDSGDGGPALKARITRIGSIAIDRTGRIYIADSTSHAVRMLTPVGQTAKKEETADLTVELHSATGSNRFQIGEEIPVQAVFSSRTPNRYLQPCTLFRESRFGFPQCRFFSRWSFSIESGTGWVDLEQEFPSGPRTGGGPTIKVSNPDLSEKPVAFSYVLTHRFRFDAPGEYRVRLAVSVGLDDETTQSTEFNPYSTIRPHKVSVVREMVLQIVPGRSEWQTEVVSQGVQAMSWLAHPSSSAQPSRELVQRNEAAANALCQLGTAEAAHALASLLLTTELNHQRESDCLRHTTNAKAPVAEMERLLVDPDTAVNPEFFQTLVMLLGVDESRAAGLPLLVQTHVDEEREKLFAALPQKRGAAQIPSLLTVLANAARSKGNLSEVGYVLPFSPAVITMTVTNFDRLPPSSQQWLVDEGWDRVRSPLMLPVVRKMALAGEGHALLRWLELDPPAATAFIREEVVRPAPRFSSFYLRLPDASLPPSEQSQIAANFVALTDPGDLTRAATLLHRYGTKLVLGTVLPFIGAKFSTWPCSVQIPLLAYLLKVSPGDAEPRLAEAVNQGGTACQTNPLFTEIGFLERSPVLDRLALAEIDKGPKPLALDAAAYLRRYGSVAAKPLLHEQLVNWQQRYVHSGAEKHCKDGTATSDEYALRALVQALAESYGSAQAWLLSLTESHDLQTLLGTETTGGLSCQFQCGASLGTNDAPSRYAIYARANEPFRRQPSLLDYLNPAERLHYAINQYRCEDMKDLKQKILQFPAGSTFDFAWDFTAGDRDAIVEIGTFLHEHGYRVGDTHGWPFLQPDN